MTSKETKENVKESFTERLQAVIEETEKKNLEIKADLKKLEGTKKEKDAKVLMDTIYNQLDDHLKMHQQTEKEIDDLKDELRKKLGKPTPKKTGEDDKSIQSRRPMASPEEQVLTYELKSQLLRNVEMQNHRLKTELTLHEKMTEAKLLNQQNKRLTDDNTMSKTNTLRLMKMFEKKAKDADAKLKEMQLELNKAQQLARKYHQMYDMERRRNGLPEGTYSTPEPESGTPRQNNNSSSFLGQNVRVNDVIRKNEVLVEENEKLHREIARLKQDNAGLIKKCKHAMSDKESVVHRLDTSEANRRDLTKRLDREKTQHNNLSRSLTRQASDWILLKKQLAQFDEEYRWSQMKQQCEEEKQRFGLLPPIYYYMPTGNTDFTYNDDSEEYSLPPEGTTEPCLTPITEVDSCFSNDLE
ncbi:coiled-coil domain-containing protein 186-like isoform X8 [Mytilus californianus]|uniref:coiled-coil domain-containing protein 186-like isoform X8 n=1 Tax=Mytilus californianus TaxID=6549 RepID=UPI002245E64E|nr:coiled-coil domain-containing protein 186-like isoform X8 [Mytilus californianus]